MTNRLLHVVLIKTRPDVSDATMEAIFADLRAIRTHVEGIGDIIAGRSKSPEQLERGYTHGFTIEMENFAILEAYQAHPQHKAVGARLVESAVGGIDGILVLDIPFNSRNE